MSVITTPEEQAVVAGEADGALEPTPSKRRRTERGSGVSATRKQQTRAAWAFLALPGALFLLFTALPVVIAAVVSLSDYAVIGPLTWTGFDNYVRIASDPFFWVALRNTVLYTVLYVPLGLVIAMATALLLNRSARSARVFRTLFYIPVVSSTVATATIWYWVLNPQHGLLNEALSWFGINGPAWLYDSHWAMFAIVMMSVWAGFGGNMMIFLGGLQGVSPDLREAARLDGANAWQVFRYVVVPSIRRTTFLVSTLLIINAFQVFDQAYVLTKGGPGNSTVTIVYYIYDRGFGSLQMGYASALSFILFVIILAFSLVNARLTNRDTER